MSPRLAPVPAPPLVTRANLVAVIDSRVASARAVAPQRLLGGPRTALRHPPPCCGVPRPLPGVLRALSLIGTVLIAMAAVPGARGVGRAVRSGVSNQRAAARQAVRVDQRGVELERQVVSRECGGEQRQEGGKTAAQTGRARRRDGHDFADAVQHPMCDSTSTGCSLVLSFFCG